MLKKKTEKRKHSVIVLLLTFFLMFCLLPLTVRTAQAADSGDLPAVLYVGGVKMAPEGIEKVELGTGTAFYNRSTNTLTLSGITYKGPGYICTERNLPTGEIYSICAGIYYKGNGETLNIILDGENRIEMEMPDDVVVPGSEESNQDSNTYDYYDTSAAVYIESADAAITGKTGREDTLSAVGADGGSRLAESSGIFVEAEGDPQDNPGERGGNLTVSNCTVDVKGLSAQASGSYENGESEGIYTEKELILRDVVLTASGGAAAHDSAGIEAGNKMTVEDSTVNGISGEAGRAAYGIFMDQDADIVNSTVTGKAIHEKNSRSSYGIDAEGLVKVKNSTMNGTGGPAERYSDGIYFDYMAEITDSVVSGISGKGDGSSAGIYSDSYLLVSGSNLSGQSIDSDAEKSHGIHASFSFNVLNGSTVEGLAGRAVSNSVGVNVDGILNITGNSTVTAVGSNAGRVSCGADVDSFLSVEKGSVLKGTGGSETALSVGVRCGLVAGRILREGTDYLFADYGVEEADAHLLTGEIAAKAAESGADISIGMELVPFLGDVTEVLTDDQVESEKNEYILWVLNGDDAAFSDEGFLEYLKNKYSDVRKTGDLYVLSGTGSVINEELNVTGALTAQGADGGLLCLPVNADGEDLSEDQRNEQNLESLNPVRLTAPVIRAGHSYDGSGAAVMERNDETDPFETNREYPYIMAVPGNSTPDSGTVCPGDESCPLSRFSDTDKQEWYHDGVHWALENGIMNGTGENTFEPMTPTSRAMIVTMLWRMEGSPVVDSQADYRMNFKDVPDDQWYTEAVRWAAYNGIVLGMTGEEFSPDTSVTREQLAAILYRNAQAKGHGFTEAWAFPLNFEDADQVSEYAYEPLCWMTMNGIIRGMSETTLSPKSDAVRA